MFLAGLATVIFFTAWMLLILSFQPANVRTVLCSWKFTDNLLNWFCFYCFHEDWCQWQKSVEHKYLYACPYCLLIFVLDIMFYNPSYCISVNIYRYDVTSHENSGSNPQSIIWYHLLHAWQPQTVGACKKNIPPFSLSPFVVTELSSQKRNPKVSI